MSWMSPCVMQVCSVQVPIYHRFSILPVTRSHHRVRILRSAAAYVAVSPHNASRERCLRVQMVRGAPAAVPCQG